MMMTNPIVSTSLEATVYSVYGYAAVIGASALCGFAGQPIDPFTGCYLLGLGHRAYSPTLMRFLSPDRVSPFGAGGINGYAYCQGEPINHVDRNGQNAVRVTSNGRGIHPLRQILNREMHGTPVQGTKFIKNSNVLAFIEDEPKSFRRVLAAQVSSNALELIKNPLNSLPTTGVFPEDLTLFIDTVYFQARQENINWDLGRMLQADLAAERKNFAIENFKAIVEQRIKSLGEQGDLHTGDWLYSRLPRMMGDVRL